jgi:hypothetical protein
MFAFAVSVGTSIARGDELVDSLLLISVDIVPRKIERYALAISFW